jgi:phosphotransacetylase
MKSFTDLLHVAKSLAVTKKLVVCQPADPEILHAISIAMNHGLVDPILVGFRDEINETAENAEISLDGFTIEHVSKKSDLVRHAISILSDNDILMKGQIQAGEILREVLSNKSLNAGRIFSGIMLHFHPKFDRPLFICYGALNIEPDLWQKKDIIQNAINFAQKMGVDTPIVAVVCPIETVNPSIQETIDAACLSKMAERGMIKGGRVEGPLALDNALSEEAAARKSIRSPLAGHADILMVQNLSSSDILMKALTIFGEGESAKILTGAKIPVVMTSRSDSVETIFNSIVLSTLAISGSSYDDGGHYLHYPNNQSDISHFDKKPREKIRQAV